MTISNIIVAYLVIGLIIATCDTLWRRSSDTFLVFSLMVLLWILAPLVWLYRKLRAR